MGIVDKVMDLVDGKAVVSGIVKRQMKRKLQEALEKVPVDRIRKLIEDNATLSGLIESPEKVEKLRQEMQQYARLVSMVSDEDIIRMAPAWLQVVVGEYEDGESWLRRELPAARQYFFGGANGRSTEGLRADRDAADRGPGNTSGKVQRFVYVPVEEKLGATASAPAKPAPGGQ